MLLLGGAACRATDPAPPLATPTAVLLPTPTLASVPTTEFVPDTGWLALQPGLERRVITLQNAQGLITEEVTLLRIDPQLFALRVAYRPGEPLALEQWQAETGALVVVNGGYFTTENTATGLIIVDGVAMGSSYDGFAGMLAVSEAGPELRWLAQRPYNPDEALQYGLQSFPVLVKPGGIADFPDDGGAASRRTVIAQDHNGRILLLVAPWGAFTLHNLSRFLGESDLGIDIALNLDGGTSSGMLLAEPRTLIAAYTALPAVITVHPR